MKTAFDRANELVLELPPAKDQAVIQQVVMKHALDLEGRPLPEKLSPEARDKLRKALAELGAPPTAFDRFKPFFAAMTLAILISQKSGLTGEKGAEAVLSEAAQAASKPVSGLETFEYQLSLFDKLPETEQIKMLEETLDNLHRFPELFREMNALWSRGDAEGFAKLMIEMSAQSPAAYKLLLSDRNARWAEWIDRRLDAPGVVFVGVGAGHFGGEDNVHELLAKRGIKSARVPAE